MRKTYLSANSKEKAEYLLKKVNVNINKEESERFLNNVQKTKKLKSGQLYKLNIEVKNSILKRNKKEGIF